MYVWNVLRSYDRREVVRTEGAVPSDPSCLQSHCGHGDVVLLTEGMTAPPPHSPPPPRGTVTCGHALVGAFFSSAASPLMKLIRVFMGTATKKYMTVTS